MSRFTVSRFRWPLGLAAAAVCAGLLTVSGASTAAALPAVDAGPAVETDSISGPPSPARAAAPTAAAPKDNGGYFDGVPTVGTFFADAAAVGAEGRNTYCTASVVHSKGRDLVLTAGHCAFHLGKGKGHRVFVPGYRKGRDAAHQPYGVYPVQRVFKDPRYRANSKGHDSDLDFAFARLGPDAKGRKVEDVTGALKLGPAHGYAHKNVTVIGYPVSHNGGQQPRKCTVNTDRLPAYRQMEMVCGGYYGGVSGGPWISGFNPRTGTGTVIGNVGGYNGGGNDSNVDWVCYSPVHGAELRALYDDAVAGREPKRGPYVPAKDSPGLPGKSTTWKHAKLLASGDYTGHGRSDLLVVWTDGEVTLYPSDGRGGFAPEHRLKAPNGTWKHATSIAGGDFAGSQRSDLMVLWSDGEVSLYPDVGTSGFGGEVQMAKPGSVWKYARQITAGRFNAKKYVTDLTVRWKDGEVSLYTDTGPKGFGQEHTLVEKKNPTWEQYPRQIAGGQFAGRHRWDLMVRWKDGELDSYTGTSPAGLGPETRLLGKNRTWTYARAMTAGDYMGDGVADDLVVRWADGETTLYTGTRSGRLGTEHRLVSPHSM